MSFTYINPGYGYLLDYAAKSTTLEDAQYNPFGNVAFLNTDESGCVKLPTGLAEIYIKCSAYVPSSTYGCTASAYLRNSKGCFGWSFNDGDFRRKYNWSNENVGKFAEKGVRTEELNDFLIYIKSGDSSTGQLAVTVNGKEAFSEALAIDMSLESSVVLYSNPSYSYSPKAPLSNIIISDSPVACGEKVALLSVSGTDTNMTDNQDGSYSASADGQYCFQFLDVGSLIANYGETSAVKGLYIIGNPAYRTGVELAKAVACGRKNGVVEEYGSCVLGTKPDAHAIIGGSVSMTLGDLQGMEFGWKAGV